LILFDKTLLFRHYNSVSALAEQIEEGNIMKKFVVASAVLGAALGLTACTPAADEAEAPVEAVEETPAMTEEAPAADGAMAEEGVAEAEDPEGQGNPVDR
jgi:hypothetical protein